MTISQQTTSLLDTTREAGLAEYAEAVVTVQDASLSMQRDPGARLQKVAFEEL